MSAGRSITLTSSMIYLGILLISVLSFFTTYAGLAIFLAKPLALIGSLGLQTAMLGIAWNIMRVRQSRAAYALVFASAAAFSIFFSYANFSSSLKGNTRAHEARAGYAEASRPVVREFATVARQALARAEYQEKRVTDLLELEDTKGWATIVDEGSNDPVVQEIIDGARRTVDSWQQRQGTSYRQGAGKGIISNYLASWRNQVQNNLWAVGKYVHAIDSLALMLNSNLPVTEQYDLVNYAVVNFPTAAYAMITTETPSLPEPPFPSDFVEKPANGQQALMLVIADLYPMDRLTFFSLLFAFVIDFIVIVMAICGSLIMDEQEYVFDRVEKDSAERIRKMNLDDPGHFAGQLDQNIQRMRHAGNYGKELGNVLEDIKANRQRLTLIRGEERLEKNLRKAGRLVVSTVSNRVSRWREKRDANMPVG
ncbi:MAG: hypothetical protein KKA42_01590 [candidate division Zixibacteria bacterium]|nr:hypothetical protein [candidate division Zixibacteria bacterium]